MEVFAADDVELTVTSFSRHVSRTFVHAPVAGDRERFLSDLEEKIIRHKPDEGVPYVLIPVFNETEIIAENRERFERHIRVAAPPIEAIRMVHPKHKLWVTAEKLGLRIPRTWTSDDVEDMLRAAATVACPCVVKPRDGIGGRGFRVVKTRSELQRLLKGDASAGKVLPLVQELVSGDDFCLSVLAEHGSIKAAMAYRNLRRFPAEGGAGVVRETVAEQPFLTDARTLCEYTRWHGIMQLDFIWSGNPEEAPVLIEVNARFWLGLFQSVQSGVDFPWLLFQLFAAGHIDSVMTPRIGTRTKIPGLWLMGAIQDIASNESAFERLRRAWMSVRESAADRTTRDRMDQVMDTASKTRDRRETFGLLRTIVQEARTAKNDIFYRDDPFIALGVMFILASLIRHRRLPPEIRQNQK
ncbi:MAG: ATP-grasp domain-containing protein [bacterium]